MPLKHPGRKVEQPVQNLSLKFAGENEDEAGANTTGIAVKFLVDLQRFIACRKVMGQEHLVNAALGTEIKIVVSQSRMFSPRTNLMFRSNAKLRTTGLLLAKGVGVVQFYFCLLLPDPYKQIPILG